MSREEGERASQSLQSQALGPYASQGPVLSRRGLGDQPSLLLSAAFVPPTGLGPQTTLRGGGLLLVPRRSYGGHRSPR